MRLLSLNVERLVHLQRFVPFLRTQARDVACLQELVESDIDAVRAETALNHCPFVPMSRFSQQDKSLFGTAVGPTEVTSQAVTATRLWRSSGAPKCSK